MAELGGAHAPSRYAVLVAGAFTALGTGAIYMWSIFNKPLIAMFGYSTSEVSFAYSLFLLFSLVGSIAAGTLQNHVQSRFIVLGAGVLFGAGWIGAGFAGNLGTLYFFFSVCAGTGNGALYNTIVAVVMKWFPDRRGFANGICIGAIGISSFIFAPLGNMLIESFDVQGAFRIVGLVWVVVYGVFSWLLVTPPAGWAPATGRAADQAVDLAPATGRAASRGNGKAPAAEASGGDSAAPHGQAIGEEGTAASPRPQRELSARQMLKTPLFYCLFLIFLVGGASGHMISGHTSNIAQGLAGLSPAEGAMIISVMAIGSTLGRFGFGAASDKAGRYATLLAIFALNAVTMIFVLPAGTSFASLALGIFLAGACFGGVVTILPAMTGDAFGSANFGQNYAFVYAGQTAASFVGPIAAATAVEATGTYLPAFALAGALSLAGIALTLACRHFDRKLAAQEGQDQARHAS